MPKKNRNWLLSSAAAILLTLLCGCVSNEQFIENDARKFSEISVLSGDFNPKPGDKIAWYSPFIWSSDVIEQTPELRQNLTELIEQELVAKGYQIVPTQAEANYVIGVALVDKNNQGGEALRNFFSLFPSLSNSSADLPESMAMVGLIAAEDAALIGAVPDGSSISLWRAALSAYVLGDKVSEDVRIERFRTFIGKLMQTLPGV